MLRNTSFNTAISFSNRLNDLGAIATPRENTLLSNLVKTSIPVTIYEINTPEELSKYGEFLEANTTGTLENLSLHDIALGQIVDDLSKIVTKHISFAKTEVKPAVITFAEEISKYIEANAINKIDPASKFNITILDTPSIIKDESFIDLLKPYVGKNPIVPGLVLDLGVRTNDELINFVSTGYERTDIQIAEWYSNLPEGYLESIWNGFFTKTGSNISPTSIARANVYDQINAGLAIYLIGRKIFNDVQLDSIPLNQYKNLTSDIRDYGGSLLNQAIIKLSMLVSTKILVVEANYANYYIKVNGDVYRAWLEQGGSIDVLLGMLVSNNNVVSQSLIDEKAADYKAAWNSYITFSKIQQSNNNFRFFKEFLFNKFNELLKTPSIAEIEFINTAPAYLNTVKTILVKEIDSLVTNDINDPYDVALRLIGKARFFYSSSFNILNDINEASKINPNIEVREAALFSAINYLSDFLSDQIALSR